MLSKYLNLLINILTEIAEIYIVVYCAIFMSKIIWWVFTPVAPPLYFNINNHQGFENSAKAIINYSPFGVFVEPKVPQSSIVTQIKLTGLYVDDKNSLIFYELHGKSYIAKIGDKIGDDVIIKNVMADSITVAQDDHDFDIKITPGAINSTNAPQINDYNNNTSINNNSPAQRKQLIDDFMQPRTY